MSINITLLFLICLGVIFLQYQVSKIDKFLYESKLKEKEHFNETHYIIKHETAKVQKLKYNFIIDRRLKEYPTRDQEINYIINQGKERFAEDILKYVKINRHMMYTTGEEVVDLELNIVDYKN